MTLDYKTYVFFARDKVILQNLKRCDVLKGSVYSILLVTLFGTKLKKW